MNKEYIMEYFDLDGIISYKDLIRDKYDPNSDATKIFNDTRTKINYLAELLSKKLDLKLHNNYNERINKQAGKGANFHNYKDYILVGYVPKHLKEVGDDIFIKISFGFWESIPQLHYQLDINYKKSDNPYIKDREYLLGLNDFWLNVDGKFPQTWEKLLDKTEEDFKKVVKSLEEYLDSGYKILKDLEKWCSDNAVDISSNELNMCFGFLYELESRVNLIEKSKIDSYDYDTLLTVKKEIPNYNYDGLNILDQFIDVLLKKEKQMISPHPLNQILFGCPGSGKTYSTKKLAVEIIEDRKFENNTKEEREEILRLYDHYSDLKQIRFTTFHQSLGYEDFIEGIKPKTIDHKVTYEVEDGIFTKIASKAQDNWLNSQSNRQSNVSFEDALTKLKDEWEEDSTLQFPLKTKGSDFTILSFNEKNIRFRKSSGGTGHTLSFNTMKELFYGEREHTNQGVGIYYPSIIEKLNSYSDDTKTSKKLDRFVLIMDEINRGNISAIFGELITLIEDDKRLGSKESIEVILPYSKENFGVPPNLYLIGTMNTADRSVEALDTALRRRFSFTEMKSDPQVLVTGHEHGGLIPDSNINLINLLETINKRIELLVDKDHQIGHSYFIGVNTLEDLKYNFKNKIIPLLEEYFYGDFGKIGLVLGDNFVETNSAQENKSILSKFKGYEVDFLTDKKLYSFKDIDSMNPLDFISIYKDIPVPSNNES